MRSRPALPASIRRPGGLYSSHHFPGNPSMIVVRILTALLVLTAAMAPAMSQDRRVPVSPADIKLSYAPIVQRVQPAGVNGDAAKMVQNRNPLLDDPIFRRFFGVPAHPPEQMQRSLGSG